MREEREANGLREEEQPEIQRRKWKSKAKKKLRSMLSQN